METRNRDAPAAPASSDAGLPPPPPSRAETLVEAPRRRGAGALKRKASSNLSSAPSKRFIKEMNALNMPSLHNGPCTRARQSPSKIAGAAAQRAAEAAVPTMSAASGDGGKVGFAMGSLIGAEEQELAPLDEPIVDAEFDLVRSRGSNVHVVPTPAVWFSWKEIHPIEKSTLASFFNRKSESKTPEIYMEIRNSIMRKFHANPQCQLELKDLEDISLGDLGTKQEVMEFLDHWGLINFHPFLPESQDVSNSDAGEKRTSLLEKLYQFETVQSYPRFVPKKVEAAAPAVMPRFLPESSIAEEFVGSVGPSVEYHCNSCSADCSRKRYHCQKQADFDLCTECYNNEKFGSGMAPSDFILMEPAEIPGVSGGSWTDQETLLLLEALELFAENWNEIAEHVATKTKAQCMLHFLQMPIEDPFLEGGNDADEIIQEQMASGSAHRETTVSEVTETKEIENAEGKDQPTSAPTEDVSKKKDGSQLEVSCENGTSIVIDALKAAFQAIGYMPEQEDLPSFAEAGNPVMALAAFLTQLVEPDAVSTPFRSSLKAMSEDSPGIQLAARHCFLLEDPPNDKKDPHTFESAATDTTNEDAAKERDQAQVSDGNDESRDRTDKNKENAVPVKHEKCPMESDENVSTENKGMENSKNSSIENENSGVENDKILSVENEKTGVENDKISVMETEKTSVENKNQSIENEKNPSIENEKSPSTEPSLENGKSGPIENEQNTSDSLQDCLETPSSAKESNESILPSETAITSTNYLGNTTLPGEQIGPSAVKDGSNSAFPIAPSYINPKDSGNPTLPEEQIAPNVVKDGSDSVLSMALSSSNPTDSGELALQGEAITNAATEVNELKSTSEDKPDSEKDSSNLASVDMVEQILDTSMVGDTRPSSKEQESKHKAGIESTVESVETLDGDDRKVLPSDNGKDKNSKSANDQINHNVNKLKRAAVTVLSAAAVKAKLLGNQEEDQIRQLVSLIIEKQLHKLEAKLALFTDIEGVIMRMREQTDRARHRLMHERAQIIAARLGLPTPARGNSPSLPTNKLALGYGTTGSTPTSISSQKAPPMRRP